MLPRMVNTMSYKVKLIVKTIHKGSCNGGIVFAAASAESEVMVRAMMVLILTLTSW